MTIDPERITVTDFSLKHRVTVHYTGSFEDGEVFDTTIGRTPLTYVEGNHEVVPGFEIAVLGMEPGEKKTVRLEPKDAYGEHDPRPRTPTASTTRVCSTRCPPSRSPTTRTSSRASSSTS